MLRTILKSSQPYTEAILNFIYPPFCLFCRLRLDSGVNIICESCWSKLPRIKHQSIINNDSPISRYLSVWEYSEGIQELIHEMKFRRKKGLAHRFAAELSKLVLENKIFRNADLLLPVPLHKLRLRERGFNQSLLLAKEVSKKTSIQIDDKILNRVKYTKTQSKLSASQRQKNVEDAFKTAAGAQLTAKKVILIDDVITTGSTMNACAKALTNIGVGKVLGLSVTHAL